MRILTAAILLCACSGGSFPGFKAASIVPRPSSSPATGPAGDPGTPEADAGTPDVDAGTPPGTPDAGPPATGCGSGGGGATGGPADLFPCDSPWYRNVSALAAAPESAGIIDAIQSRGGWGLSNHFQVGMDYALIHGDASTSRQVWVQPKDSGDHNEYYLGESDLLSGTQGWSVPTPAGGHLEGEPDYTCPQSNGVDLHDCHLTVVDDARHLLIELYGAVLDPGSGRWYATQESVWNLNWHYSGNERGLGCTSADAAGLPISPGVIGLRETTLAARSGGDLGHALRVILPNDRTRQGFVAPASHAQGEAQLTGSGPPYGVRLRLKASFDESRVSSPGARAVVRTLKKYGMILADGGQTALTADDEVFVKQQDPTLTWSGLLAPLDLDGIQATDFEVVDYDTSTLRSYTSCTGIDHSPLGDVSPKGRPGLRPPRPHVKPTLRWTTPH